MSDLDKQPPSPRWSLAVIGVGLVVFGIYASTHMVAAGDTWVAMACGRHFSEQGVDTVEPFSFNSHSAGPTEQDIQQWPKWAQALCKPFSIETIQKWHPTGWINQNWLTHLIFFKLAKTFGTDGEYNYNTLVYWKFVLYILTAFAVYGLGRTMGVGRALALAASCFALVVGRSFYDIRPAGYSNLLVPVFMLILALAVYKQIHYIWLLVPLIVFWANVHGGYLYAFMMLVPFVGLHLLAALPKRWTFALGVIGIWWVLYMVSHQFLAHQDYKTIYSLIHKNAQYQAPSLLSNDYIFALFVLTVVGIGLVMLPEKWNVVCYLFYTISTLVIFLVLYMRLQLEIPYERLTVRGKETIQYFVRSAHLKFWFMFFAGILFTWLLTWKKNRQVTLPPKKIGYVILAGGAAFLAMLIFNPFHFTNLTHTFEISVSDHAASWRQVNEWRPAFDWMDKTREQENPVGNEEAFAVLCILLTIAFVSWIVARLTVARSKPVGKRNKQMQKTSSDFEKIWPKIDLPLMSLAAMTIYMAIQSRRFIAIAGPAACPLAALLIYQAWQMGALSLRYKKSGTWAQPVILKNILTSCWAALAGILVVFTLVWSLKYKKIYLDPWPNDPVYNSVFMRMTASNVKPFEICDFMNDNQLSGRMFNYWTEGGALAFGQKPDPDTGQIPLKLFMDGRAQAAYNHDKYQYWQSIFSAEPEARRAALAGKKIDYVKAGRWVDGEIKKNKTWVIVMPNSQSNSTFLRAIRTTGNWKTVYLDAVQRLLVDTDIEQGKQLVQAVFSGKASFPDDFSRHVSTAALIVEVRNAQYAPQMFRHAEEAFAIKPCSSSFLVLTSAFSLPPYRENVTQNIRDYYQSFRKNKDLLKKQDGYLERLNVAVYAADFFAKTNPAKKTEYRKVQSELKEEALTMGNETVW